MSTDLVTLLQNVRVRANNEFIMDPNGEHVILLMNARVRADEHFIMDPNGTKVIPIINARVITGPDYIWTPTGGAGVTYTKPALTITAAPVTGEVGSTVNIVVTPAWVKNDAGNPTNYKVLLAGAVMQDIAAPAAFTLQNVAVTETAKAITSSVSYAAGPIKNDSGGQPAPGNIAAGTINSNTINVVGYRKAFWTTDTNNISNPATSADIRAYPNSANNINSTKKLVIELPVNTKDVIFAVPASLGTKIDIRAASFGGVNYLPFFNRTTVNVDGATAGQNTIPYNVFHMSNEEGIMVSDTYTVTIT